MDEICIADYRTANSNAQTAANFYSQPPWHVGAWRSGILVGYATAFGAADNILEGYLRWGVTLEGQTPWEHASDPTQNTITWVNDTLKIFRSYADASNPTTAIIPIILRIPDIKTPDMSMYFTLSGTAKTVDLVLKLVPDNEDQIIKTDIGLFYLETAVTAVGSTPARLVVPYNYIVTVVNVTAFGSALVIRVEGSVDGTNWFNLDANGADFTVTATGTYMFASTARVKYVRVTEVSSTGAHSWAASHTLTGV